MFLLHSYINELIYDLIIYFIFFYFFFLFFVYVFSLFVFFFFQAEDGIRDTSVTGVQTCALPISSLGGLCLSEFLLEALGLVVGTQGVHQRRELAVHDVGKLMQRQADAVIGHAILGKIVRADFFGAVAGFDLAAPLGHDGGLLLFLLHFIEARAKNAHGFGAIFNLRFLVLLRNDEPAGDMRDAYRRIRCVHGLAAGTGRAERINAQILGLNLDVDFVRFGKHGHGRRGSMDAALLLGGRNALDAVHAAFVFQLGVNLVALNRGDHFLHAAERGRRAFQNFYFPALRFRVARIHAEKLRGEERGFVAAGSGANFDDDALFVVGIFREQQEFQFALDDFFARGERLFFFVGHLFHLGVVGFKEELVSPG